MAQPADSQCRDHAKAPALAAGPTPFLLVLTGTSSRDEAQAIADATIETIEQGVK